LGVLVDAAQADLRFARTRPGPKIGQENRGGVGIGVGGGLSIRVARKLRMLLRTGLSLLPTVGRSSPPATMPRSAPLATMGCSSPLATVFFSFPLATEDRCSPPATVPTTGSGCQRYHRHRLNHRRGIAGAIASQDEVGLIIFRFCWCVGCACHTPTSIAIGERRLPSTSYFVRLC